MAPALTPAEQTSRQAALLEFSSMSAPSHCPLGMYILPSSMNALVWNCVLFIHRGYYADSVLRFTLTLPTGYPHSGAVPSVVFSGVLPFHPLVDPRTGAMNLSGRWLSWTEGRDWVWMVLHWVKAQFKRKALEEVAEIDVVGRESWKLFRGQTELFAKMAKKAAMQSIAEGNLFAGGKGEEEKVSGEGGIVFRKLGKENEEKEVAAMQSKFDSHIKARLVKRPLKPTQ